MLAAYFQTETGPATWPGTLARAPAVGAPGTLQRPGSLYTATAAAFGITVSVHVRHDDGRQAQLAIADALREVRCVDRLMRSDDPHSQVWRLNRDGVLHQPDPHLLAVLNHARALSRLTRGAFDMTVQPLWQAFREAGGVPSAQRRTHAQSLVAWNRVAAGRDRVAFGRRGMAITLDGLARGYAADLARAALRRHGVRHALVDTGESGALGTNGEQPWTIGVPDPRAANALAATVRLDGRCVATSGDYGAPFSSDFLHHHILDPATGDSPTELASVTVLAPTGLEADGLSTAFMVMGARRAHALAAHLPGVDLLTMNKRGVLWKSAGFPGS